MAVPADAAPGSNTMQESLAGARARQNVTVCQCVASCGHICLRSVVCPLLSPCLYFSLRVAQHKPYA